MTATVTANAEAYRWLPPLFDARGLCPTLARIAFVAYEEEKGRQGLEWYKRLGAEMIRRRP